MPYPHYLRRPVVSILAIAIFAAVPARAEVTRLEVTSRTDVATVGYEKIVGRIHFAVDPRDPRNSVIDDLDKAPRNAAGRVEFSSDFYMLRPKSGGNLVALVDVVNRGRRTVFGFNRAADGGPPEIGDGLLMKRGFTIVCVGWEFDVPVNPESMRIDVPVATDNGKTITGIVRTVFTPDRRDETFTLGDVSIYPPVDPSGSDTVVTVRDGRAAAAQPVARERWKLSGQVLTLTGGFEPGRIYEVAYRAANPPIGGLGFAAVRDTAAWVKYAKDAVGSAKHVIAFGSSQSGRFLRDFLYEGFNTDEHQRQVFDGVMAHIAGASRLDLNRRWSTPTTVGTYGATAFPFADRALRDPVSGITEGLLENSRARENQPKVFYTNTGVEYWGGGRSAALVHTSPDGTNDLELPPNVRVYFLTGAQHSPGRFPPEQTAGQQRANPTDYWWTMRALLVGMERWVKEGDNAGAAPPASQYPRLDRTTLVKLADVAFPSIPGVQSPRTLSAGVRVANTFVAGGAGAGAPLPLLVPQVDADGNERSGIRLPEVAVPLATYTGWNFRNSTIGGTDQLVALMGSYVPFARTAAEREARKDPRPSLAERYASRERYLEQINAAAAALVKDRYLLADDVLNVVKRATQHWDLAAGAPTKTSSPNSRP